MKTSPLPANEADRIAALRSYEILDTACEAAFDNIAQLAAKLTGSPVALVSLVDKDRLWFKARHGLEMTEMPRNFSFCTYAIMAPNEVLVVPDATKDPRFTDNWVVTGDAHVRFYAGAPLVNPQGFPLGTLCIVDNEPREMSEEQLEILVRLAETVTTTLELQRAMHQVHRLALTDALTGIANRPAFLHALERSIAQQKRHGNSFALIYLDLDGFKRVNDLHGHAGGDQVLREVATTLTAATRREDIVARLGGDEFVVILVGDKLDAVDAAERIRIAVAANMDAGGWQVTASVGAISFLSPPKDTAEALAAADELMYSAKLAGKNCMLHREYRNDPESKL